MRTTPTGLADLARAYRELNPAPSDCLMIAHLVGLDGSLAFSQGEPAAAGTPQVTPIPGHPSAPPPDPAERTSAEASRTSQIQPRPPIYAEAERVRRRPEGPHRNPVGLPIKLTEITAPASGEIPPYIANAEQLDFDPGMIRRLPMPEPLVPIAQLRSLITDLIAAPVPGDPDIERLLHGIARGHLPRVLPRKQRKGAARRIHVLVDTADSMRLFQRDAATLLSKLRQVAGPAIQSEAMTSGPPAESHSSFSRGDMLLIVSDLSIGSRGARRTTLAAWRDFVTLQHTHGVRVVALVPYHYTRWPAALKQWMRLVHWHRPGSAATPATPEQLRYLARALSLAAVIDPALLRLARMTLLPTADAGAEADFAKAPWVSFFNPRVVGLLSAWTVELRSELARDPELLELARRLLDGQRPRSADWDRVVYEEQIVFLALQTPEESSRKLEEALARVIRSLLGRLRDDNSAARWALCFIDELPDRARKTPAAQLLKAVASRMLSTSFDEVQRIVTEYDAKWVFEKSVEVGVLWDGDHIIMREPAHISDRIMLVPDTRPRVVIVEDDERNHKRVLRISKNGRPAWIFARPPRRLGTAAGATYEVESLPGEWEILHRIFKAKEQISTTVSGIVVPRGYRVNIGLEALLPERELLLAYHGRTDFIGTRVTVRIVEMNEKWREITVGLVDFAAKPTAEVWRELSLSFRTFERVRGIIGVAAVTAVVVNIMSTPFAVPFFEFSYEERGPLSRGEMTGQDLDFGIVTMDAESNEVTLTRNFKMFDEWKKLLTIQQSSATLRGTIREAVRGGFRVDIGFPMFPPAFIPTQLMGLLLDDIRHVIGRDYDFRIDGLNWPDHWNIILTRREVLDPRDFERLSRAASGMKVGDVYQGVVRQVTDFVVVVAIGDAVGIIPYREIFWGYGKHPGTLFKPGDVIDVRVIRIDRSTGQLSLSWKALQSDETFTWVAANHPVGSRFRGRVRFAKGDKAFVQIEDEIDGVLHASQMTSIRMTQMQLPRTGDEVDALVIAIEYEKRSIRLSLKFGQNDPWNDIAMRYPVGSVVLGRVDDIMGNSGVRVVLSDGLLGLVHRGEIPGGSDADLRDLFVRGAALKVRLTGIDTEKQYVWFTIKDVPVEELTAFAQQHPPGTEIVGTIEHQTSKAIFVKLAAGVEGVLQRTSIGNSVAAFSRPDRLRVTILRIDLKRQRIDLRLPDRS